MICPECSEKIAPVDHNGRGPRCPSCWAQVAVEVEVEAEKPKPAVIEMPKPRRQRAGSK